jgi:Flp pilus assembly protein TadD
MPIRDLAFEHRMYLPLASVAILTILALHEASRRMLRFPLPRVAIPAVVTVLLVVGLTIQTIQRNRLYHDPVHVWQDVVQRAPKNERAAYNLGQWLVFRGMVRGGPAEYQRLLLKDPKQLERQGNRFEHVPLEGDLAEAKRWFLRALELDPKDASAHFNLGGLHDRAGLEDGAILHYRQAIALKRKHLNARINLTRLLTERGLFEEATLHASKAVQIAPKDARTYTSVGLVLVAQGRHEEAIEAFRKAFTVQPKHTSSRYRLALSLWALDRDAEAIAALREIRLKHRNLNDVNLSLARFLMETDEPNLHSAAEAAAIIQPVINVDSPHRVAAHEVLAQCQAELGRFDLAVATIDRGLALADPQREAKLIASLQSLREQLISQVSVRD